MLSNAISAVLLRWCQNGLLWATILSLYRPNDLPLTYTNTMPAVPPNTDALVLVSGANGYIAYYVIRVLLEKGYRVRGTVRSGAKVAHLKETFASYKDKLEIVVVPDITAVYILCKPGIGG